MPEYVADDVDREAAAAEKAALVKTLLLIDLVGSTAILTQLGDEQANRVFTAHDDLARSLLEEHRGREIDKTDGFLMLFERPIQAVHYALAYHRALADLGEQLGVSLNARAGIHLGEVYLRENPPDAVARGAKPLEVDGLAKHMAARVMALARGRQTLLTRTAFDLARRAAKSEAPIARPRWLAHGPYTFQGIEEPVEVFEVGLESFAPLTAPPDTLKACRAVAEGDEVTLGWRPANGHEVPWRPNWVLERKLGEGSFGEVWLARHEKIGDRRVFKFCYEAKRLRSLRHEVTLFRILKEALGDRDDITRILDWNFQEAPFYLESEYTHGGDLTSWAAAAGGIGRIPLATRLEIIAQAATALAAAHSVGVLHKDIKPSNILITTAGDGSPKARLTDFGIGLVLDPAKIADQGITMTGLTELSVSDAASYGAGTRLYLSPELLEGKPPTIQSDIFALGVMLFQVVVGDLSRALAPSWRREVEDELLAEDIACFVDGAPEKRPASAHEVAERLRHLERRRREREAARRERREAEQARLALARSRRRRRVLATFSVLVTLFAAVLALQIRRTAAEAERANREAEVAQQVSAFLVDLFEVSDPDSARGNTITAREILDQGAARIRRELSEQPEVRATLMLTIGQVYRRLGLFAPAEELLDDVLETRRQVFGREHAAVAEALHELGGTYVALGEFDVAEKLLNEAVAMRRKLLADTDPDLALSLRALASLELVRGNYPASERLYRESLSIYDAYGGDVYPERSNTFSDLAVLATYRGDSAQVGELYDRALSNRAVLAELHPTDFAAILSNKGHWLLSQGRFEEAEVCLQEALAIKSQVFNEKHYTVALTRYKLADLLNRIGDYPQAEAQALEAVEILRRELPSGHWRIAFAESILGQALTGLERFEKAEELLLASYPIVRDSRGDGSAPAHDVLKRIVALYEAWGKQQEAERYRVLLSSSRS